MKRVVLRLTVAAASAVVALALAEGALAIDGRYNHLVSRQLVTSPAIWEPPAGVIEYEPHPDLDVQVEVRLDATGVRNHHAEPTDRKRNIIAFFGDSFAENRRVIDEFTFTTLLDNIAERPWRVVNYGVDAYGLDQMVLRYRKYAGHDIKHVVYLFTENDLRNLYETGLVEVDAGRVVFHPPGQRVMQRVLGKIRLTYLAIQGYQAIRGTAPRWFDDEHTRRFHDAYADAVVHDFLNDPSARTLELADTFRRVLEHWRAECEARGQTFTVLVLPRDLDTALAAKLLQPFTGRVVPLWDLFDRQMTTFENDDHWNERGNLRMAEIMSTLDALPFHAVISRRSLLDGTAERITRHYQAR